MGKHVHDIPSPKHWQCCAFLQWTCYLDLSQHAQTGSMFPYIKSCFMFPILISGRSPPKLIYVVLSSTDLTTVFWRWQFANVPGIGGQKDHWNISSWKNPTPKHSRKGYRHLPHQSSYLREVNIKFHVSDRVGYIISQYVWNRNPQRNRLARLRFGLRWLPLLRLRIGHVVQWWGSYMLGPMKRKRIYRIYHVWSVCTILYQYKFHGMPWLVKSADILDPLAVKFGPAVI